MFIDVILPLSLDKYFTYQVNEEEFLFIQPGMRVVVPFGKSKYYTAIVYAKHLNPPLLYEAKDIHLIVDERPVVHQKQLEFWVWLAEYYMCSVGDVYKAALPSGLILESETILTKNKDWEGTEVSDEEYLVLEALLNQNNITVNEVSQIVNKKKVYSLIQGLIEKGLLQMYEEVKENYKPKLIKYVKLHEDFENENGLQAALEIVNRAQKQRDLLMCYFQLKATLKKEIQTKELLEAAEVQTSVLKGLVDKKVFQIYYLNQDRVIFEKNKDYKIDLSEYQNNALNEIKSSYSNFDVTLLHGVTASGKTEVYIKLIEEIKNQGKQVLFLLPEIALTAQIVQRLTAYFGNEVAVYHSKFNSNERIEVWKQVLENSPNAKIVLGVRSALFLPFSNLGLIIVDEEHEATYKQQDPAPRYHARDCAIVLAKKFGAKVLLGSATPSLDSYYNTKIKKYGLVELAQRFNNYQLPEILLIDLKDKYFRKQMSGHFSDDLLHLIQETINNKEQVILLQNRRGFASFIECIACGHVPQCPHCDVSLTYYKFKNVLKCHYCGYHIAKPTHCHSCNSLDLSAKGFGTEQVEQELHALIPHARIARMDQDTTRGKFAFEKMIDSFKNKEIDVLIGTQMLAKGLDFDDVTLVGVLNADNLLNQPNYRAYERGFQLMMQVAGRAGRKEKKGRVIIQTYNPVHNTIQQVVHHNYLSMFNEQIHERRNFMYAPYYRIIQLKLRNKDYEKLKEASYWLFNVLQQELKVPVLGPEEPPINRIRNEYIRNIVIKIPNNSNQIFTKKLVKKVLTSFESIPHYRAVKITINVDY